MKILLINPSQTGSYGGSATPDYLPLGLAYIGAVLEKNNYQVKIIDIDADKLTESGFISQLKRFDPALVGITALTPSYNGAIKLASLVKQNSAAKVVLGGIHPTVLPEESIKPEAIDFVIKGEGEDTFLELVRSLEGNSELAGIKGLVFKEAGRTVVNPDRLLVEDLDRLPYPARHLFKQHKYSYPDALLSPAFPIITSRGCPGNCTYCNAKSIFTRKLRIRSPKNTVGEIEHLINEYGAREIHIWDDNFITRRDRVFAIRDEFKARNIKVKIAFPNGLRADYLDEDILKALREMGTYSIAFGVESGSQEILDRIKKGMKISEIEHAFKLAKRLGFETWGFFMLGLPGENNETIRQTINFAKRLNPDVAKFHILQPYPGTEIFDEFKRDGLINDYNYDHYSIHSDPIFTLPGLSSEDLIKGQQDAYRRFYLRPGKLFSQLLRVKTWNRLKLNLRTGLWVLRKIFPR